MRILVLGARGMLGHTACWRLRANHEVWGTSRLPPGRADPVTRFIDRHRLLTDVDAHDMASVRRAVARVEPDAVLNCVGIIKQIPEAQDAIVSIEINSLFPHHLSKVCSESGARLVHFSTDCVFSGSRGRYRESDVPDPVDLYGRSKLLGELSVSEGLTLRTSAVGREITRFVGLFEWVLGNRGGKIRGFDRAIFSGFTTAALVDLVEAILTRHPDLTGVWHLASEAISKYELIKRLVRVLDLDVEVERDEDFVIDRSLDGSALGARTGLVVPTWEAMLTDFAAAQADYEGLVR